MRRARRLRESNVGELGRDDGRAFVMWIAGMSEVLAACTGTGVLSCCALSGAGLCRVRGYGRAGSRIKEGRVSDESCHASHERDE